VFCLACGRNLEAVERLPTRAEWVRAGHSEAPGEEPAQDASAAAGAQNADAQADKSRAGGDAAPTRQEARAEAAPAGRAARAEAAPTGDPALAARCADATAAFLAHMRAAGNPGTETFSTPKPSAFKRARRLEAWVLWPVDREDFARPRRYEPGLLLTVDGDFHRLDSELRGWGQRNFPYYQHTASLEPVEMPVGERLLTALDAARAQHDPARG
jgi:hypothetical protein